ncbi:MAG: 50S ribosomal protein L31e [Candidatus Woesearchaeota archaeon]|jgi:large subunit ribosomal protein L31e
MAKLERNYTIPLRENFVKVPKYYRSKRAINHIKAFIVRHMKVEEKNIKLGKNLNEKVWMHGIKNPPSKVKVKVTKDNDTVTVELEGFDYKVEKIQTEKTEKATTLKDKLAEKMGAKEDATKESADVEKTEKKVKKAPVKKTETPVEPEAESKDE